MQIVFGIDFGTTNSALSVYRDGAVEVVNVDDMNPAGSLMRSVLYFTEEEEVFTGGEAIRNYVDDGAAGRFMQSIKTFLPSASFENTVIFGRLYCIDDLVAILLKALKAQGEAHVGRSVDSVVLGRPVAFSTDAQKDAMAQKRLESAARKAGFRNIWFQYEPVAAALAYEETLAAGDERILFIGDFGGGTSDFSIIRVKGGAFDRSDRRSDVLSLGGVYVAGDKFDSQVMGSKVAQHFGRDVHYQALGSDQWTPIPASIIHTLCQWHRIPLLRNRKTKELIRQIKRTADDRPAIEHLEHIIEDNFGFALFQAIEQAKCELSEQESSRIRFTECDLRLDESIERKEFEQINEENFDSIETCIDEVISRAGLNPAQIDTVSLTGGTSKIPHIRRLFEERFGPDKSQSHDAFTSVAHGLGSSVPLFV